MITIDYNTNFGQTLFDIYKKYQTSSKTQTKFPLVLPCTSTSTDTTIIFREPLKKKKKRKGESRNNQYIPHHPVLTQKLSRCKQQQHSKIFFLLV